VVVDGARELVGRQVEVVGADWRRGGHVRGRLIIVLIIYFIRRS